MRRMFVPVLVVLVLSMAASAPDRAGNQPSPSTPGTSPGADDRPRSGATFDRIDPGERVNTSIATVRGTGVSRISISVENPAQNVAITVTRQDGQPADVAQRVQGTPYRYMEITASNLSDADIAQARIDFAVNQSWIAAQNVTAERVRLARYTAGNWSALPTTVQDRTNRTITYAAETPGFSYFTIFARDRPAKIACGNGVCQANQTWQTCPADCEKPGYVVRAEQKIGTADARIDTRDDGYSTLQDAKAAYDAGNYSRAATLAQDAIEEHRTPDRKLIRVLIPVLLPFAVFFAIIYWKRDTLARYLSDDKNDSPD